MPNYIRNRLTILSDNKVAIQKVMDSIRAVEGDEVLDFNRIDPIPEPLGKQEFDISFPAQRLAAWMCRDLMYPAQRRYSEQDYEEMSRKGEVEEYIDEARLALRNILDFGSPSAYRWQIEHWGTKWNAFNTRPHEDCGVDFETAWSCPIEILKKMSAIFPEVRFRCEYADEDVGYNCGVVEFQDGDIISEHIYEEGSDKACEFSFMFWPEQKSYYAHTENGYEQVDE